MVIVDRFFFDEIFMMDSSKDMDKTLVGFFLEGRFVFFFLVLDQNLLRTFFSLVMFSRLFGIYMRNFVGENFVSYLILKIDFVIFRYFNYKLAFRVFGGTVELLVVVDMLGDFNEFQKVMIIDMGSSDENVIFVQMFLMRFIVFYFRYLFF